jgi:hypothetical protein
MKCQHIAESDCERHGHTSPAQCRLCPDNTAPGEWPPAKTTLQKLRLGTRIANATRAVGIKPCGGCKRRAQILNGDPIST